MKGRSSASPVRAKRASGPKSSSRSLPREVRIIGGSWKRSLLPVPDKHGLRPTPDRVRETLFNWLGQDLSGFSCVDAFAGTGALGFEAASRGAPRVLAVEDDAQLVALLRDARERLHAEAVEVARGDGVAALRRLPPASVDLVFIDPPFDAGLFDKAIAAAAVAVKPGGWVYLEAPEAWDEARLAAWGLKVHRYLKAGAVHAHLLQATA